MTIKCYALALIVILEVHVAVAQSATHVGPPHCYLEATNVSNLDEIRNNWQTDWGLFDRDHFHQVVLKIRVGTTARTGGPVTVAWFWVGRKLIDNQMIVYGHGNKQLDIPAAYFTECYAVAPELINHVLNVPPIGARFVSGARHEGWIVSVSALDNRVMEVKASSEPLKQLFLNESEFSKLLPLEKTDPIRP